MCESTEVKKTKRNSSLVRKTRGNVANGTGMPIEFHGKFGRRASGRASRKKCARAESHSRSHQERGKKGAEDGNSRKWEASLA